LGIPTVSVARQMPPTQSPDLGSPKIAAYHPIPIATHPLANSSISIVAQPQLLHSTSKQSISASEDFHSFSDDPNHEQLASEDEQATPRPRQHLFTPSHFADNSSPYNINAGYSGSSPPFHTPNENPITTNPSNTVLAAPISPLFGGVKPATHTAASRHVAIPAPLQSPSPTLGTKVLVGGRKSIPGSPTPLSAPVSPIASESTLASPTAQREFLTGDLKGNNMEEIRRHMTPGVDDSPIIQFALDQLTRDVDVRGSRSYPIGPGSQSYTPVSAAVSSKPYSPSPPIPERATKDPAAAAAAAAAATATAVAGGEMIRKNQDSPRDPKGQERPIFTPIEHNNSIPDVGPSRSFGNLGRDKEMRVQTPPQRHPLQESAASRSSLSIAPYDVFVPYNPAHPTAQHPHLTFTPILLRPLFMGLYILLCTLILAGLIFSAVWSKKHDGVWGYIRFGDARYFVFEYLPTLLGMLVLLWLFQIQISLQRIAPYMAMAANSTVSRSQAAFIKLYPSQFIYPNIQYFRSGQVFIGAFMLVCWLFLFTVPLLASSFNVRWVGDPSIGEWRWLATQGVIWTIIALYIMLILALIGLVVFLQIQKTGLKWDPRSLADIVALLERANIMADYADSETFTSKRQFRQRLWSRTDRLGYWHTSRRPHDVFYGIGEEGGATRRYSIEQGRIKEKQSPSLRRGPHDSTSQLNPDLEAGAAPIPGHLVRIGLRNPEVWHNHVPWQLSSSARLAYMLVAVILLIAFFVVTFVHKTSVRGFFPKLQAQSDANGFSSANFLYSFLPAFLGLIAFLLWQPLDFTYRRLAPFAALSAPGGAHPEESLLLDYPFTFHLYTATRALSNGDLVVAVTSILSLVNFALPILAGGIYWAQWYPAGEVRVAAQPGGLYALCAFLVIYALGYVFLFAFGRPVALPHSATCLADIISWLYMSPMLADRAFSRPESKHQMVERLGAPIFPGLSTPRKRSAAAVSAAATATTPTTATDAERQTLEQPEKRQSGPPRLTVRLVGDAPYPYGPHDDLEREAEQDHNIPVRGVTPPEDDFFGTAPSTPTPAPLKIFKASASPSPSAAAARKAPAHTDARVEDEDMDVENDIELAPPLNATAPLSSGELARADQRMLEPMFGFGVFVGRDGREHLGIERVVRGGREMEMSAQRDGRMKTWN
jgi:Protein of unknown function (DUF3433)